VRAHGEYHCASINIKFGIDYDLQAPDLGKIFGDRYLQDGPAYNLSGYTKDRLAHNINL